MTKEKTARLIPNAIQVCTDTEKVPSRLFAPTAAQLDDRVFKSTLQSILFFLLFFLLFQHFFTSFGARDRTYMMMFRLWQNALLDKVSATYWSILFSFTLLFYLFFYFF